MEETGVPGENYKSGEKCEFILLRNLIILKYDVVVVIVW
jgi:hypothetical protein